jgi:hypothetical protein
MKTLLPLLIGCFLTICSIAHAETNPYREVKLVPNIDRSKLRQPKGDVQIIRVPHFTKADFDATFAKGQMQIGMVNFNAPPNPNEANEVRLEAKRIKAEVVYILDDGKHPYAHFILFYGIKKPEFMTVSERKMSGN